MKKQNLLSFLLCLTFIVVSCHVSASAQSTEDKNRIANLTASGLGVRWDVAAQYSSATITVLAPDGRAFSREFKGGVSLEFALTDGGGERLPDGQYTYELRLTPIMTSAAKESLAAVRGADDDRETVRAERKRGASPGFVQSGSFSILNGTVIVPGAAEEPGTRRGIKSAQQLQPQPPVQFSSISRLRRQHHLTLNAMFDQVIPDDLIVQGSICAGLDCVNNENFGFDTIRLKENNTRLQFDDTSISAGFATNNWQIRANNSASGGGSFLGFVDQGATGNSEAGTIVFQVDAGAPANSLKVSSTGRVGVRTATPVLDVHMNTSDTPAIRLEQNNSGGFSAQTWDVASNEANFFVRDVTGGSRLPFRIRPGAPTSSLDISASGNVGVGTGTPTALLSVFKNQATGTEIRIDNADAAGFAGLYLNGGFSLATGGLVQYNNNTGAKNLFVATGGSDPLHFGTNNAIRMTVLPTSGNVGIATSAPTDTLSVNGTASKPGGGSWAVFSDERLKTIKGRYTRGLRAALQLQPIRFEYKQNNALGLKSEAENIGFGAQALQEIIPEAVTRNANGYLQVNNDPIIWTMLNAIKEQQKEIEQLKQQVRKLQTAARRRK